MIKLKDLLNEGDSPGENDKLSDRDMIEKRYAELGSAQRGKAESLGVNPHRLLQGSLSYMTEHIGDLVHRLSYNEFHSKYHGMMQGGGGIAYGGGAAREKINKALFYGQDFIKFGGMEKVVKEIAKRNYDYVMREGNYEHYADTFEEEWENVLKYLKNYVNEHRKLTPLCYSYYQKLANVATIAMGEMNTLVFIEALEKLKKLLERKDWAKYWYDPNER